MKIIKKKAVMFQHEHFLHIFNDVIDNKQWRNCADCFIIIVLIFFLFHLIFYESFLTLKSNYFLG